MTSLNQSGLPAEAVPYIDVEDDALDSIRTLSDVEVVMRVEHAAEVSRLGIVELVVSLAELERRGLHLRNGYSSLYKFCIRALKMSEDQAYRHANAVKLARKYPVILEMLEDGRIHLASLAMIRRYLLLGNEWLIEAVAGLSKREVQKLLALFFPKEIVGPAQTVTPLTDEMAELKVVMRMTGSESLEECAEMMAHQYPEKTLGVVIEQGANLLKAQLKAARGLSPHTPAQRRPRAANKNHVTRAKRGDAFEAAGHRCTYQSAAGVRCDERAMLEVDHIEPRARGGSSDASNLRILCQAHNQWQAKEVLGEETVHLARARKEANRETQREEREVEEREAGEREAEGREATALGHAARRAVAANREAAKAKLESALKNMGFSAKIAQWNVSRYADRHPNADFRDLGATLGDILRNMT